MAQRLPTKSHCLPPCEGFTLSPVFLGILVYFSAEVRFDLSDRTINVYIDNRSPINYEINSHFLFSYMCFSFRPPLHHSNNSGIIETIVVSLPDFGDNVIRYCSTCVSCLGSIFCSQYIETDYF